jgi:hypothetical protein
MDMNEWSETPTQSITLEQMDSLVDTMAVLRTQYETAKRAATELHNQLEEAEQAVLNALAASGKKNYTVDGVGQVYTVTKEQYTTPKVNDDKTKLFNYIKDKYGPDVLMTMVGINHQTLNSWANKETETGDVMTIPGLQEPTSVTTLSFRRK